MGSRKHAARNLMRSDGRLLRALVLCTTFLSCSLGFTAASADIYKFVDRHGGVHLADRPLGPGYVLIYRGKGYSPETVDDSLRWWTRSPVTTIWIRI
jgi:hypothetical protein